MSKSRTYAFQGLLWDCLLQNMNVTETEHDVARQYFDKQWLGRRLNDCASPEGIHG